MPGPMMVCLHRKRIKQSLLDFSVSTAEYGPYLVNMCVTVLTEDKIKIAAELQALIRFQFRKLLY